MTCRFKELFTYEDGRLYWAVTRGASKAGSRAGTAHSKGYRQVQVDSKMLKEHRVIYEMHHGQIPEGMQIDHINGVRDDNRIENLRVVTQSENNQNRRQVKGFCFDKSTGKFTAYIGLDGKKIHLGTYETEELAREAYLKAKADYHPTSPIVEAAPRLESHGVRSKSMRSITSISSSMRAFDQLFEGLARMSGFRSPLDMSTRIVKEAESTVV
ncbi:MAG: hypothetical protein EB156_05535, partial [Euryarchaeota archaeon]|nr:hypothetical protein [Euryarchaeota archaeon]